MRDPPAGAETDRTRRDRDFVLDPRIRDESWNVLARFSALYM